MFILQERSPCYLMSLFRNEILHRHVITSRFYKVIGNVHRVIVDRFKKQSFFLHSL